MNFIWIRKFSIECDHTAIDGGYTGVSIWDYYWKGELMLVETMDLNSGCHDNGQRWARKKLLSINIPLEYESQRVQIIKDLELAFTAFKSNGVLSRDSDYSFSLEV